ncbi:organellar and viral DNA polymerase type B, partial [Trichomonas vaginalis G3]|uniref:organellar and viral DNA polymerase type B n=1 Tax=Trichomonas vaginalis (strain ATCC PRA-98 / G3) TaxID=412133 RepID=UPI0021E57971
MFHLQCGEKEVFPYQYYSSSLLVNDNKTGVISEACKFVKDIETFMKNIDLIENCRIDENHFDLEKYSSFYCKQDVRILREGFVKFRNDILKEFDLNVYDYVSICSIANKLFENRVYFPNGNLYDLSNKPREFISRCIQGGRCMLSDNMKQKSEKKLIADFDAVSLYPSAIARLYTLEGIPKVMKKEMLNSEYLLKHLFDDDQGEPEGEKFISGFFVLIKITEIKIKRHFPLITVDPELNPELKVPRSSNTCCLMYVDHIALQDLIKYQGISCEVLQGYYYDEKRDFRIRDEVKKLFEL